MPRTGTHGSALARTAAQLLVLCVTPFQVGHSKPAAVTQPWTLGQCPSATHPPSPMLTMKSLSFGT